MAAILGLGLLIAGVVLLLFAGFLFFTIILIPLAIIAGLVGLVLLIIGVLAAFTKAVFFPSHHQTTSNYTISAHGTTGQVKFCTRCGAPNAKDNDFCTNCGKKFLE